MRVFLEVDQRKYVKPRGPDAGAVRKVYDYDEADEGEDYHDHTGAGVSQLTMESTLQEPTRLHLVSGSETFSIVTGPKPAPSVGGWQVTDLPRSTYG